MAAGATAANADIVEITPLVPNFITHSVNNLNEDVTNDDIDDVMFSGTSKYIRTTPSNAIGASFYFSNGGNPFANVVEGVLNAGIFGGATHVSTVGSTSTEFGIVSKTANGLIPIEFTDADINGGATVKAWVDVSAKATDEPSARIDVERVIYDEDNPSCRPYGGPQDDITAFITASAFGVKVTSFSYNPKDGKAELSFVGAPGNNYKLTKSSSLPFVPTDIKLTGITVGSKVGAVLDKEVMTDGNDVATVQFNLGTSEAKQFVRVEHICP